MDPSSSDWRTRAADLFQRYYATLLARLGRNYPTVDQDVLNDAFVDAVKDISEDPAKFDPSRGKTFESFLYGAIRRELAQAFRRDGRRIKREKKRSIVAEEPSAARSPLDAITADELAELARSLAETDQERNVLQLWELHHSDAEIATELQMTIEETSRIRDRLLQRIRRLKGKVEGQEQ